MEETEDCLQRALESEQVVRENLKQIQQMLVESLRSEKFANDRFYEVLLLIGDQINNPLNGLINNLVLVREYFDKIGQENEELEEAYQSAIKLNKNIKEISQRFSVKDNRFFPNIQKVNLYDVLQNTSKKYAIRIRKKNIEFNFPEWSDRELMIFADPVKLTDILEVLLDNAIRHTQKGSISITIHVENIDFHPQKSFSEKTIFYPSGQRACIAIKDTGCGMDSLQLDRLNNRKNTKTTIGLSIVISQILLEMMDGIVVFASGGTGRGTTIRLYLPITRRDRS
ncbi:MAG: HAMP domain-containing histidine kinase [Cyanobacteria bacterium SBLK]|nr:HAMP domain-containing histidine kinase [Cyanobacteria bacterium SBLK]